MLAIINPREAMISDYRCFFCFARAFGQLIENENISAEDKKSFTREMATVYTKICDNFSAPVFSRELHTILKQYTNNIDPYKLVKKQSNDLVLNMYFDFKKKVDESGDPFDTALRLDIAGNIIDFGISGDFDLQATIDKVLHTDFAINQSSELKHALLHSKTVLYLGDNAGEIVFDKLFIETIAHANLYYAVRGGPVINDVTIEDALYVGMNKVSHIISNGYDAPSTIVEHCSPEFNDIFDCADIIISKGHGNLEGLLGKTEKEVYYLLMVKCDVIADTLKVKKGDFVVKKNH